MPASALTSTSQMSPNNMTLVFRFWDAYTDAETGTYLPPNYFSGILMSETDFLTFLVTEDTPQIRTEIAAACQSSDFYVQVVTHSFADLIVAQQEIEALNNEHLRYTRIAVGSNSIEIHTTNPAATENALAPLLTRRNASALPITIVKDDSVSEPKAYINEISTVIYVTDGIQNRLVGIVKSSYSGNTDSTGITWWQIADFYYACTGQTLTIKLS